MSKWFPPLDPDRKEREAREIERDSRLVAEGKKSPRQQYQEYLKSGAWRALRNEVIDREEGLCQVCGSTGAEVHHTDYDDERIETLVLLCPLCHFKAHAEKSHAEANAWIERNLTRRNGRKL